MAAILRVEPAVSYRLPAVSYRLCIEARSSSTMAVSRRSPARSAAVCPLRFFLADGSSRPDEQLDNIGIPTRSCEVQRSEPCLRFHCNVSRGFKQSLGGVEVALSSFAAALCESAALRRGMYGCITAVDAAQDIGAGCEEGLDDLCVAVSRPQDQCRRAGVVLFVGSPPVRTAQCRDRGCVSSPGHLQDAGLEGPALGAPVRHADYAVTPLVVDLDLPGGDRAALPHALSRSVVVGGRAHNQHAVPGL
mmetsp:Transcript_78299/g.221404  ORF Transcript_78299/g.221404 Transcript_78299/m.221404 type:complete len:248 (-) Transcript_78299:342-1085(-)